MFPTFCKDNYDKTDKIKFYVNHLESCVTSLEIYDVIDWIMNKQRNDLVWKAW